jgi:protein-L-isoaspartate O-methyltransferase
MPFSFGRQRQRAAGGEGEMADDSIARARRCYAEELRFTANLHSRALVDAFATVPRERFVGPGPWRIRSPMDRSRPSPPEYWTTDDADPRHVYHDGLIALDEARALNNGQPSLYASLFDHLNLSPGPRVLHLGCGTGYHSVILAEVVGRDGKVTAVEVDETLADRARTALEPWSQAVAVAADGTSYDPGGVTAQPAATVPIVGVRNPISCVSVLGFSDRPDSGLTRDCLAIVVSIDCRSELSDSTSHRSSGHSQ